MTKTDHPARRSRAISPAKSRHGERSEATQIPPQSTRNPTPSWRAISSGCLVWFALSISSHHANAQPYPPTQAGLQQLVAQDAAMLPTPYAIKLRKKLSDWEHGVGVTCYTVPNLCFPAAKDVIADIQAHIFKADGFVIDSDSWSVKIPSADLPAPSMGLPVTLSETLPNAVSPTSPAARSFNQAAHDFGLQLWRDLGGPPRSNPKIDNNEDLTIDYAQNADALPGVISIGFTWGDYQHGAAHGEFGEYDFNWNVARQRPLQPSDIFDTKTDWKRGLATAIFTAFQNASPYYVANSQPEDFILTVSDSTRWAITKIGLRLDTDVYELGGYSEGAPSAVASWSSLKPYLKHGGLADP